MPEQVDLILENNSRFIEESIIITEINEELNYILSNSLDTIKIAIFTQTKQDVKIENAKWQINSNMNQDVINLMNKYQAVYAVRVFEEDGFQYIIIFMRAGNKWFITKYAKRKDGKYYCWDYFLTHSKIDEILEEYYLNNKIDLLK